MPFELPELPYERDALEPHISAETLNYHYGKHHQAYVNKLNGLTQDNEWSNHSLEQLIKEADGGLFITRASLEPHLLLELLNPNAPGAPAGDLAAAIDSTFGSFTTRTVHCSCNANLVRAGLGAKTPMGH